MPYATTNPPQLLVPSIGAKPAIWAYSSTDVSTAVRASSYISNGSALGMKVGDAVFILSLGASSTYVSHGVGCVSAVTASSGATIATGTLESTA